MEEKNHDKNPTAEQQVATDTGETLGDRLKRARQGRHITLEEAARATRIHATILAALEEDNRGALPAEAFTRGFIKNYARYLGLDPEEALQRYRQKSADQGAVPEEKINAREVFASESLAESPFIVTGRHIFLVLLLVVLSILGYWSYKAVRLRPALPPKQTAVEHASQRPPEALPQKTEEPAETAAVTGGETTAPSAATPAVPEKTETGEASTTDRSSQPVAYSYVLEANFVENTWIRIRLDNEQPREFFFYPGQQYTWRARTAMELFIGNAGGVALTLNGSPLPPLGASGKTARLTVPLPAAQ